MSTSENIKKLFQRFIDNDCTPDELRELLQYFDAGENELLLRSLIEKQSDVSSDRLLSSESLKSLSDAAYSKIQVTVAGDTGSFPASITPFFHRLWFRISAAAVLIFSISIAGVYFVYQKNDRIIAQQPNSIPQIKDVPPGTDNAILRLDNGTTIVLDSLANGNLPQQGNIKVLKTGGQIAYDKSGKHDSNNKPVYNTISTARGNQYQVILSDGSKIWLNAASSIRFPSYFTGTERKVAITGEAYFEVAKDLTKPFKVFISSPSGKSNATEIEVLGTHFNVNSYTDELDIKTTLLEGSVKIKRGNHAQMLTPGLQARLTSDGIIIKKNVAVSEVVAWKDGFFVFNNSDIKMIMRQVARWYDIDVFYEGKTPEEGFTGKVSRNVPLSKFLKMIELNGINVKTDGRKITIEP